VYFLDDAGRDHSLLALVGCSEVVHFPDFNHLSTALVAYVYIDVTPLPQRTALAVV